MSPNQSPPLWRSLILAALLELILLALIFFAAHELINRVSWPAFVLLLIVLQFPTGLLVLFLEWIAPGGVVPGVASSVVYAMLLFIGQTAVFTWWFHFRANRGTWSPSLG